MKTIKCERQVRLDELIKHCIDNDTFGCKGVFTSTTGKVNVTIYKDDVVIEDAYTDFNITKTFFTITEEVGITEDTILEEMVIVRTIEYRDGNVQKIITLATHKSISDVKGEEDWNKKSILHEVWTVKGNGMGELIWTKERGLID
ncbi:hypothetical protein QNJ25_00390 [Macrococcus caseolyticus]|uniref:hypothetical protein n=1 Tax=Macrococcoides caseolyticum TaxID=69966 RepID=UPI0024BC9230|nr:hypothetical protein [Macrococcus caseolyticus]MDJ1152400.1 hypothetical protein [Macrococcus caseolyticus]